MTTSDTTHRPVFVAELISFIVKERSAVYCDSTCGYGHFAERLAKATGPQTRIFAIDIDPDAVNATRSRLAKFGKRCVVMRGSYVDLPELAAQTGVGLLNGVVIDGGLVSREQLLDPEKGLSFMVDGMLDMRIDPMQNGPSAADLVNTLSEQELVRLFRGAGESSRTARVIAAAITAARRQTPLLRTGQLARVVEEAVDRAHLRRGTSHPATRVFLALRNRVSNALPILKEGIRAAAQALCPAGRLCIISYFGSEHALVKKTLRELERGCVCPPRLPICGCGRKPVIRLLVEKALSPSFCEVARNESARSARLHVARRTGTVI